MSIPMGDFYGYEHRDSVGNFCRFFRGCGMDMGDLNPVVPDSKLRQSRFPQNFTRR